MEYWLFIKKLKWETFKIFNDVLPMISNDSLFRNFTSILNINIDCLLHDDEIVLITLAKKVK